MSVTVELNIPTGVYIPQNDRAKYGYVFGYSAQRYVIPEILPSAAPVVAEWQSYAPGRDFQDRVVVRADIESGEFYQRVGHRPTEKGCYPIDDQTNQDFSLDRPWMDMPPCAKEYGEDKRCRKAWEKFLSEERSLLEEEIRLNSKRDFSESQDAYYRYHAGRFVIIGDFLYRSENQPRLVITRSPSIQIFPAVTDSDMSDAVEYLPLPDLEGARKRFTAFYPGEDDAEHWPFECPRPDLMKGNFFRERVEMFVCQFLEQIDFETGGKEAAGYDEFLRKLNTSERETLAALQTHAQTTTEDFDYDIGAGKALLLLEPTSALWSVTETSHALRVLRTVLRTDLKIFEFGQSNKEPSQRKRLH